MSAGTPIQNFERATSIPGNSLHLMEMGDGSGTKAVTQEVLEEKIGEALKVGDLEELQTENKENLVAAINEAAQSGGGGAAVDILDTKEEIEANTEAGKAAGALAVQEMFGELNDNLVSNIYVGTDGKLHKVQGGADTVIPFSSKPNDFSTTLKTTLRAYGSQYPINVNVCLSNGVLSITGGSISTTDVVYGGLSFNKNLME